MRFISKSVVAAVGAFVLMGSQAYAADLGRDMRSYGPIWAGFYGGAHLGIAWASVDNDIPGYDDSDTDLVAGIQGGYNWLTPGGTVYGVEVDYTFTDFDTASIRGRIGQVMGDKLIYATAGVAFPDDMDPGFVIGGGVEWDLSHRWRNVSVGVEGLYYTGSDDNPHWGDVDWDAFVVRGRVNYHFGTREALK